MWPPPSVLGGTLADLSSSTRLELLIKELRGRLLPYTQGPTFMPTVRLADMGMTDALLRTQFRILLSRCNMKPAP